MPGIHARHSRRDVLRLGAGAVGAAFLAACGLSEDDEVAQPLPGFTILDSYAREPGVRGGVLRLGVLSDGGRTKAVWPMVYSALVGVDPRTNLLYGDLAQSVELRDPLSVAITLRPELRFHPDEQSLANAITSEDVAFEFEMRRSAGEFVFSEVVDEVITPDLRTLVLKLRAPFAQLFETLADARASGIRSARRSPVTGEPLGSGPFVTASRDDAGDSFARNQLYHRAEPLLDGATLSLHETADSLGEAFSDGLLDVLPADADQSSAAGRSDILLLRRAGFGMLALGLSLLPEKGGRQMGSVAAFQDERVREAVSLGIDREVLARQFDGRISGPVGPAFVADALPSTELRAHRLYRHAPADAHALLVAADATGLEFRVQTSTNLRQRSLAEALVRQLSDAGFAPRLLAQQPEDWERDFRAGDFEATAFDLSALATPDLGLRLHMSGGIDETFSSWGYSNPRYDQAVRGALSQLDPSLRAEQSRAAQRLLLDDVPAMLPLIVPDEHTAVALRVGGYEFDAYGFNEGWLAPLWSVQPEPA
jgi:peptide/nickel transport system substrate-binding protein